MCARGSGSMGWWSVILDRLGTGCIASSQDAKPISRNGCNSAKAGLLVRERWFGDELAGEPAMDGGLSDPAPSPPPSRGTARAGERPQHPRLPCTLRCPEAQARMFEHRVAARRRMRRRARVRHGCRTEEPHGRWPCPAPRRWPAATRSQPGGACLEWHATTGEGEAGCRTGGPHGCRPDPWLKARRAAAVPGASGGTAPKGRCSFRSSAGTSHGGPRSAPLFGPAEGRNETWTSMVRPRAGALGDGCDQLTVLASNSTVGRDVGRPGWAA